MPNHINYEQTDIDSKEKNSNSYQQSNKYLPNFQARKRKCDPHVQWIKAIVDSAVRKPLPASNSHIRSLVQTPSPK